MMLHWTTFNATLLREKPIRVINMAINLLQQRCKNLKSSAEAMYTYRFFVQQYCVKIVVKNRPAV